MLEIKRALIIKKNHCFGILDINNILSIKKIKMAPKTWSIREKFDILMSSKFLCFKIHQ